jgi:hypothetical protein
MARRPELIEARCKRLLFSPGGEVEGALLSAKRQILQLSMAPEEGLALSAMGPVGRKLRVLAVADHSPKTAMSAHPVYQFESLADAAGKAVDWPAAAAGIETVEGAVAALHFARHGQPNGVMLDSGEFIHLRPGGMAQLALVVGSQVCATGRGQWTVLGTRMLEASEVNGVEIA